MRRKLTKCVAKVMGGVMAIAAAVAFSAPVSVQAEGASLTVPRFESAPAIDGSVTAEEWGEVAFTVKEGEEFVSLIEQNGVLPPAFSADVYLGYDSTHVYIAAVAEHENFKNDVMDPGSLWMGDCMQIQISDTVGADRNELGFTYNTMMKRNTCFAWESTGNFTMEGEKDYVVKRDGTTTVYEIALGIEQFTTKITEFTEGMTIPLSVCFHLSDGGFIEYCSGIAQEKDINLAAMVTLGSESFANQVTATSDVEITADVRVIPKFETAPTIDGSVTAEEWGEVAFTVKEGEKFINLIEQNGILPPAFSADVYLGYDSTHVYIAAVAEHENFKNEAMDSGSLWMGDCMQIQISDTVGADRNEMGFTYNTMMKRHDAFAWESTGNFTMEGEKDYFVKREGTTTVYEIALGIDQFTTKITEFTDGMTIPMAVSFHLSNGGFYEYCGGIVAQKDIRLGAFMGLGAEPDENVVLAVMEELAVERAEAEKAAAEKAAAEEAAAKEAAEKEAAEKEAAEKAEAEKAESEEAVVEESEEVVADPVEVPAEDSGSNVGVIVAVIAAVAIVAVVVVVVLKKKKTK